MPFFQNQKRDLSAAAANLNQDFKEQAVAQRAKNLNLGFVDLRSIGSINPDALDFISRDESEKARVVPFAISGNKLSVAFVDEKNSALAQLLQNFKNRGIEISPHLCSEESLQNAQKSFTDVLYHEKKEIVAKMSHGNLENFSNEISQIKTLPEKFKTLKTDEILNIVHELVLRFAASDLHFEPRKNSFTVRLRINGVLTELFEVDKKIGADLIRQIKFNANLKFNIENVPQDGKYAFATNEKTKVNVRVSSLPTNFGESLVMRFLDPSKGILTLEQLGFSHDIFQKLEKVLESKNGLILITGATGSGKTTTLQAALHKIQNPQKKIITLEDPIELQIPQITQCQVDNEVDFTFANGLKSILRQDPDIILVGEIRDLPTAQTAVQAAMTGHLVLSSLHTNSAADTVPRLLNMNVAGFMLAPALRAIVSQSLVRKVCPHCAELVSPNDFQKSEIEKVLADLRTRGFEINFDGKILRERGCEKCAKIGFYGRMCVGEILLPNDEIRKITAKGVRAEEIFRIAKRDGMRSMWEEAILKVVQKETSFSEILRCVEKITFE